MTESTPLIEPEEAATPAVVTVQRPRRKRGAGFPVVDLGEAVSILRKAGKFGTEHAEEAFAGYMGHTTANSGSYKRRIAAMRDWGLVKAGTGDRVVFTDLGQRLAYPTDADKEKRDLIEAFQNCEIFMKVWDNSAKDVPIGLEALANLAVRQLGVAATSKQWFAASFAESACVAGFARQVGDKVSFIRPNEGDETEADIDPMAAADGPAAALDRLVEASATRAVPKNPLAFGGGAPGQVNRDAVALVNDLVDTASRGGVVVVGEEAAADVPEAPVRSRGDGIAPAHPVFGRDLVVDDQVGQVKIHGIAEKPALLHQQSWEFGGGSLNVEIRFNRALPAEAFIQLGKVMAEVERLKSILAEGSESEKTE
jgi:hypothetical protein